MHSEQAGTLAVAACKSCPLAKLLLLLLLLGTDS
jgi:hypothetical protein